MTLRLLAVFIPIALLLLGAYWVTTQPFVAAVRSTPPAVAASRLEAHVRTLSESFYPRSFDHPEKLEGAASYIQEAFASAGARVESQPVADQEGTYRNVIARYGPADGPLIVIGAHYDSYADASEGAKFPDGFDRRTHTPGADDNASGVAGLLELARLFQQVPPNVAVELVAFTLEEPPHFRGESMGSIRHARALRASRRHVELMLSLEMIGYFSDEAASQSYPLPGLGLIYPGRGDFIAIVGRLDDWAVTRKVKASMQGASSLPVRSMNTFTILPGIDFSDHRSYWEEGFRALMITDTAFYHNPHYHGAGDTAERLDYRRMAQVVQAVYAVVEGWR